MLVAQSVEQKVKKHYISPIPNSSGTQKVKVSWDAMITLMFCSFASGHKESGGLGKAIFVVDNDHWVIDELVYLSDESSAGVSSASGETNAKFFVDLMKKDIDPTPYIVHWHTHPVSSATPSPIDDSNILSALKVGKVVMELIFSELEDNTGRLVIRKDETLPPTRDNLTVFDLSISFVVPQERIEQYNAIKKSAAKHMSARKAAIRDDDWEWARWEHGITVSHSNGARQPTKESYASFGTDEEFVRTAVGVIRKRAPAFAESDLIRSIRLAPNARDFIKRALDCVRWGLG